MPIKTSHLGYMTTDDVVKLLTGIIEYARQEPLSNKISLASVQAHILDIIYKDLAPKNNVIQLAEEKNDALLWDPIDALVDAIKSLGSEDGNAFQHCKKIVVLALDDTGDNNMDVSFRQAGMGTSQCIVLCEIGKTIFLRHLGYI